MHLPDRLERFEGDKQTPHLALKLPKWVPSSLPLEATHAPSFSADGFRAVKPTLPTNKLICIE